MTDTIQRLVIIFSILFVVLTIGAMLIWLERRLLALWQDRYGPNRWDPSACCRCWRTR
jgi:NADH-quinone oxidoreductase subunit H